MALETVRRRLAQEVGIVSCNSLTCDIDIAPGRQGRFTGTLRVRAEMEQNCVVTLEPFDIRLEETVAAEFWPERQIKAWDAERGPEAEIDDNTPDPEPIVEEKLEIGNLVFQLLVIAIDPHPRSPDAVLEQDSTQSEEERIAERPFAALQQLRGGRSD